MPLTKTFDPTKTAHIRWARFDFTPTSGSLVSISAKVVDLESKVTTAVLKQPGAGELNRNVDEVTLEVEESFTLVDLEEIDVVLSVLGGLSGIKKGAGILWLKDPRDAAGKVKYKISLTACSVKRTDGAIKFGGGEWAKSGLVVTNLSGTELTPEIAANEPS
ncbi:MAG: hypothetical protein JNK23_10635 [Opitutaceae bacterium]|nr:hypothetical protein [Opitutaceae bacterium]